MYSCSGAWVRITCWFNSTSVGNVCRQVTHLCGFSGLCNFARCALSRSGRQSVMPHSLHRMITFSGGCIDLMGWVFMWRSNIICCVNCFGHSLHGNELLGSWNRFRWRSKADGWLNWSWQISHLYGLTSLWWTFTWIFKCAVEVKIFEHWAHITVAESVCDWVMCSFNKYWAGNRRPQVSQTNLWNWNY